METQLKSILNDLSLTQKDVLILSVSGGVDSMCMLDYFNRHKYNIEVVHFNHQKREQSVAEAALVKHYCETYDIPFHYYTIDVEEGNFHHQAHILRQKYLLDAAQIAKSSYILTAHHLDDLLESILIKLTRGSNLLGYAGMQPIYQQKHITFVKPLLYVSKAQLLDYAKTHDVSFMDDESNDTEAYLRNRYRHAVVPIMKQENDDLLNQAKQFHEQLTAAFRFIRKHTLNYLKNKRTIDVSSFITLDDAIQDDILAYLMESYHIQPSYEKIATMKSILHKKAPNKTYQLNAKYCFIKQYNTAEIRVLKPIKNVKIKVEEGDNKLPNMAIFTFLNKSPLKTEDLQKLCYNKLAFPLWLRHRKEGDILSYSYGHKKLKKLFIDEKVPMLKRNRLWVLVDHTGEILWVEDYYINETLGNKNCLYFTLKENGHAS